jgi:SAM-dependent methyltransferase
MSDQDPSLLDRFLQRFHYRSIRDLLQRGSVIPWKIGKGGPCGHDPADPSAHRQTLSHPAHPGEPHRDRGLPERTKVRSALERVRALDENAWEYDGWFDRHPAVFESELRAIRELLPPSGEGLEIGAGTGRFAHSLGLRRVVEPSPRMADLARARGLTVHEAFAEALPFGEGDFDYALLVTVLGFVPDSLLALKEAHRIVKPGGRVVAAFLDRDRRTGRTVPSSGPKFYRNLLLFSPRDVLDLLERAGLHWIDSRQVLFSDPESLKVPETPQPGFGQGDFVVFSGEKTSAPRDDRKGSGGPRRKGAP